MNGANNVDGVHALGTQMGQMQLSSAMQQHPTSHSHYQFTSAPTGYLHQTPGGWVQSAATIMPQVIKRRPIKNF